MSRRPKQLYKLKHGLGDDRRDQPDDERDLSLDPFGQTPGARENVRPDELIEALRTEATEEEAGTRRE